MMPENVIKDIEKVKKVQEFKTSSQVKEEKLLKKYPNAKVINEGSFAHLFTKIIDPKERLEKKIELMTKLYKERTIGLEQKKRLGVVRNLYEQQRDKIKQQVEKLREDLKFWADKEVEVLEECIDSQLTIINEKIIS